MQKKIIAAALVAALVLAAGCAGLYGDGDGGPTDELVYPGAEKIEPPEALTQGLEEEWSGDVSVAAYATGDSATEVRNWYRSELEENGWSEAGTFGDVSVWTRQGHAIGVQVVNPDIASDQFGTDRSVILVVRGTI